MNSIEKEPIQLEKKPIYEDQEIEKIVKEIQEKEQKQKKIVIY
jgi:protein-tyrosine phosphatase